MLKAKVRKATKQELEEANRILGKKKSLVRNPQHSEFKQL